MEISGIEPLTPCLQSRCSPSWAIPPYISGRTLKIKQRLNKFFRNWPWMLYQPISSDKFSIERRWSSRTFRYGYLVTTSPQLSVPPSAAPSVNGWVTDFGRYQLPWCDGRCVQDPGTYSPWHADPRLLAIPTSCRRVAACSPNWDHFWSFAPPRGIASLCWWPLYYVCSPAHKGHDDLTSSPPSSTLSVAVPLECSCVATNGRGCARCGT